MIGATTPTPTTASTRRIGRTVTTSSYEWWWFVYFVSFFINPWSLVWNSNSNGQRQGGGMFLIGVTASFNPIANDYYEPKTSVADTIGIDLDLKLIHDVLSLSSKSFSNEIQQQHQKQQLHIAKNIYERGAYVQPAAILSLLEPLTTSITKGSNVIGMSTLMNEVIGIIQDDVPVGSTEILVRYQIRDDKVPAYNDYDYDTCIVGGHPIPRIDGCFISSSSSEGGDDDVSSSSSSILMVEGVSNAIRYMYDPYISNINLITLQSLSTNAKLSMFDCTMNFKSLSRCPYKQYEKYVFYYGEFDYVNQFLLPNVFRYDKTSVSTPFRRGNLNIQLIHFSTRIDTIMYGIPILSIWMYVTRHMELALDYCDTGFFLEDAAHSWDAAVAYYTGSLEQGSKSKQEDGDGKNSDGILLHAIADELCTPFNTCIVSTKLSQVNGEGQEGGDGSSSSTASARTIPTSILSETNTSDSTINRLLQLHFVQGQENILLGDCAAAREQKETIEHFMIVPLIQGYLWNFYQLKLFDVMESELVAGEDVSDGDAIFRSQLNTIPTTTTDEYEEKMENLRARMAVFATSLLPLLHYCGDEDGMIMYEATANIVDGREYLSYNSSIGILNVTDSTTATSHSVLSDFWNVKNALERNYACLGVTCEDVGEITYDAAYFDSDMLNEGVSASPCHLLSSKSTNPPSGSPPTSQSVTSSSASTVSYGHFGRLVLLVGFMVLSVL